MKKFLEEFKAFALRGSVVDLAIGVLIGGAFSALVTSLTDNIINPLIGLLGGGADVGLVIPIASQKIMIGQFISDVINFIILAFIVFLIVKAINKMKDFGKKPEAPAAPTTKMCPYCRSEIALEATRCPHCTSQLEEK